MADQTGGAGPKKSQSREELGKRLTLDAYPGAASYDPAWMLENLMGPNAVWLTEALSQVMSLRSGQRVLDLGCGKAISSIFLAKEFDVEVWATDLWIPASDNWSRIQTARVEHLVFPIHAEAHALPFADAFFDALLSVDAYHYFGTDDLYLAYLARFVKPGGQLGIVVPGLRDELTDGVPSHLTAFWQPEFWSFHSPDWWPTHWERSGLVEVDRADLLSDGWRHWLQWLEVCGEYGFPTSDQDAEMLRQDAGRTLGFARVIAHKM